MKIIGLILIVALLIIPAATARRLARSPEQMAMLASATGSGGGGGRICTAPSAWDTPSGPSIVVAALALFALCHGGAALASVFSQTGRCLRHGRSTSFSAFRCKENGKWRPAPTWP